MKVKQANQVVPGDKIEAADGIFTVVESRHGLNNTVCIRGTVAGVMTAWATYHAESTFDVITVH